MRPLIPPPYSSTLYKNKTPSGYNTVHYSIYGRNTAVRQPRCRYLTVATSLSLPHCRYLTVATSLSLPHCRYLTVATSLSLPHCRYLTVATSLLPLPLLCIKAFQLTPRLYTLYSFNCININPISPVRYRNI